MGVVYEFVEDIDKELYMLLPSYDICDSMDHSS